MAQSIQNKNMFSISDLSVTGKDKQDNQEHKHEGNNIDSNISTDIQELKNIRITKEESIVGEEWERFTLIVKPEQSGKTFIMINKIEQYLREEEEVDKSVVNFIFCDNSLLITKQTKERIKHGVRSLPDIKEPYVELSSRKDGSTKKHCAEVRDAIEDGCRNIVCCTNGKRVIDIMEIIRRMNTHNAKKYNFKIWLDEADKFENYISSSFIPLTQQHENIDVYMLTATPQALFKKYGDIRTMGLHNTTLPIYHGWDDNDIQVRDDEEGTVDFARQIADEMLANGEFRPGTKGYVPADSQKKTHLAMRDMFIVKGVGVFVVNGDGVELSLPNKSFVKINKTKELHEHIRELYIDYNVSQWPCVVTGNICISRGISIQQPDFMFNFGILSNCTKKSEVSQIAGRLKGNFKEWDGYKPPRVYTTEKFNKIAKEYEEQSREIAVLAFKKNGEEEGTSVITNTDIKNIHCSKQWSLIEGEFNSLEQVNKMLKQHGCRCKTPKSLKTNEHGFILSTTTKKLSVMQYEVVKEEMKTWTITSTFDVDKQKSTNKKSYGRVYTVYTDLNDNKSVKFLVRIIVQKNED